MYLSEVRIEGYKIFKERFTAKLNEGLTVIVGENGTGKSAINDTIRILLSEDEFGRVGIDKSDFHKKLTKQSLTRRSLETMPNRGWTSGKGLLEVTVV